jgi:hypothetical protein
MLHLFAFVFVDFVSAEVQIWEDAIGDFHVGYGRESLSLPYHRLSISSEG